MCALTWRPMPAAARSKLCSSVSAWLGVFASNASVITVYISNTNILPRRMEL